MTSRPLLKWVLPAALAAGLIGCGGEDADEPSTATTARPSATTAADASGPTQAQIREFTCGDFEIGLTSTDTAYVVSAVSSAAGVDMHTAGRTVQQICKRANPRTRPYDRALRVLGPE